MSESGGGAGAGVLVGAGVGGAILVVVVIALVIYCYMKARKEKSNTNMTKSNDIFHTGASGPDYPTRSRVNQYPDPVAHRKDRQKERERSRHDVGHVNPAYSRHGSETDSNSSDMDNRDVSPPRVRRARGGRENLAFSSDSSYEDSSSMEDERVEGYSLEDETFKKDRRRSYKQSREQDILDGRRSDRDKADGRYIRGGEGRRSRRDDFKRNPPRSDSPLTIETLEKHEKITRGDQKGDSSKRDSFRKDKRRRDPSPSQDSSLTNTGSVVTEGTEHTATTVGSRFEKNPRLRRNSPSRSSSHRRYRKDNKDSQGRSRTHRSGSGERSHHRSGSNEGGHRARSRSPGSSHSRRSRSSDGSGSMSRHDAKRLNKQQAVLPIFSDPKGKKSKSSMV